MTAPPHVEGVGSPNTAHMHQVVQQLRRAASFHSNGSARGSSKSSTGASKSPTTDSAMKFALHRGRSDGSLDDYAARQAVLKAELKMRRDLDYGALRRRTSFIDGISSARHWCCTFSNTFEPKDLDLAALTRKKFGDEAVWGKLEVFEQVNIIRAALMEKNWTINPNSDYMKGWDVVVVLCLVFTAIFTPVEIAFFKPAYDGLYVVNRVVDAVFIKDMILQFFLQLKKTTKQGTVWLKNKRAIGKAYLKTWCLFDVLAILPYDDISNALVSGQGKNSVEVGRLKIVRLLRVLRLFKLVRILKATRVLKRWETRISLRYATLYLIRFTILIMMACHWMACVWGFFGILEGTNLECREALDDNDPRLHDFPQRQYFFKGDDGLTEPYNTDLWEGQSWVVDFAKRRTARTTTNPCRGEVIYLAALYWAVMTITSIGYGDILPISVSEYIVCSVCMMVSSILWAYIISVACGVMMTMDPEQTGFEQRLDAFNALAEDQNLPPHVRYRGREYIREERYHEHYLRNIAAMKSCGSDLRCSVACHMASHFLENIWFLRPASSELRADVAARMLPHFYERRELVEHFGELCVVEHGAVGRGGRVLVPWSYWGEDMLIRNELLLTKKSCTTLTFTEIVTLTRENLSVCLVDYPHELSWFRRAATCVALVRMACIYRQELSEVRERLPEYAWIRTIFERAQAVATKQKLNGVGLCNGYHSESNMPKIAIPGRGHSLGVQHPSLESRVEYMQEKIDRMERRMRKTPHPLLFVPGSHPDDAPNGVCKAPVKVSL